MNKELFMQALCLIDTLGFVWLSGWQFGRKNHCWATINILIAVLYAIGLYTLVSKPG